MDERAKSPLDGAVTDVSRGKGAIVALKSMSEQPSHVKPPEGRRRIIIEGVRPEVDGGRFPIKRTVGEPVVVEADILADGHDALSVVLMYRRGVDHTWNAVPMQPLGNDHWRAEFVVTEVGRYVFTLQAWVEAFASWISRLRKKVDAGQDVATELLMGAVLVEEAARRAHGSAAARLRDHAMGLRNTPEEAVTVALAPDLADLMAEHPDRRFATVYDRELEVIVDAERARFSAWYELFPRSWGPPGQHGTFRDVAERALPYVASLGFDVLYLPPIHPIGRSQRKGPNNAEQAGPADPGSPWGIGGEEGGHKAVHPDLGTLQDFRDLVDQARARGVEIALDLAFQCSPEHPHVRDHPEWFRRRPDGTVQYAENPPKQYQDIYPFDFTTDAWPSLWEELRSIVVFWIEQGVRIFRIDNPHTKPFAFWEWLIDSIKRDYPDVILLSEAFTRPRVMYYLAKLGFTQSYTYFAWRNTAAELREYFTELTQSPVREFFRGHLWPNTPDILTEYLQLGGRPAFVTRLVLAATLGASYGIYGPAFELAEHRALVPGREEYLDSEKYQLRAWDLDRPDSLRDLVARVNRIRRENPALQRDWDVRFHSVDNDQLLAYSKRAPDGANAILMVVNVDPHHAQGGWLELRLEDLGLQPGQPFQVHDLLGESRFLWHGPRNYVHLDPRVLPAHIFRIRRHVRTERDFEYYM